MRNAHIVTILDDDAFLPTSTKTEVFGTNEKAMNYAKELVNKYKSEGYVEDTMSEDADYWWLLTHNNHAICVSIDESRIK